jgi:hypothetical protein
VLVRSGTLCFERRFWLGGWQDSSQNMQTGHKGLHVIREIWQAVN